MDEKTKRQIDEMSSTWIRLLLFVADELEPIDPLTLHRELDEVYRVLVSIERCARQWLQKRKGN